jgi:hypothetical protein
MNFNEMRAMAKWMGVNTHRMTKQPSSDRFNEPKTISNVMERRGWSTAGRSHVFGEMTVFPNMGENQVKSQRWPQVEAEGFHSSTRSTLP